MSSKKEPMPIAQVIGTLNSTKKENVVEMAEIMEEVMQNNPAILTNLFKTRDACIKTFLARHPEAQLREAKQAYNALRNSALVFSQIGPRTAKIHAVFDDMIEDLHYQKEEEGRYTDKLAKSMTEALKAQGQFLSNTERNIIGHDANQIKKHLVMRGENTKQETELGTMTKEELKIFLKRALSKRPGLANELIETAKAKKSLETTDEAIDVEFSENLFDG